VERPPVGGRSASIGRWCPDILRQIAALGKVALGLASGRVQHCMAMTDDPKRRDELTEELMSALGRLVG
jgi:CsoR family transcriptional regulator, copper-sensing transcriptional repressor